MRPVIRIIALLALGALTIKDAQAEWPNKPVRVVVPFGAGGASDLIGRVFANQLTKRFGQPFYVENRTGSGGLIGSTEVARAAPDGHTILISGLPSHVLAPPANKNVNFNPLTDFTHIAYLGGPPQVVVVHPSLGMTSFQELLAWTRAAPDGIQYVTPGIGSTGNAVGQYLSDQENIKLRPIMYRGGGSAVSDLLAGHVKVGLLSLSTTMPHIKVGKLKALTISSENRLPELPNVPTLVELGYPRLVVRIWCSLSGPAQLPRDIVNRLNDAINNIVDLSDVQSQLSVEMVQTKKMTPGEVTEFMKQEIALWAPVARRIADQRGL